MKSFRVRLAVTSTVVSGVILAAVALAAWFLVHEVLFQAVDAKIRLPASAFARGVHPDTDQEVFQESVDWFVRDEDQPDDEFGLVVVMRNDSADVLSQSTNAAVVSRLELIDYLPLPDDLVKEPSGAAGHEQSRRPPPPRGGSDGFRPPPRPEPSDSSSAPPGGLHRRPIFFTKSIDGELWRIGAFSGVYATVFAGLSLSEFDRDVRRMRNYFLWGMPLALLLTAWLGWLVAGKAVRPVLRISETAERVTAQGLDQRIPESGHEDREFAGLVRVLNQMIERLEGSFQQAARFSADASHELKTPLTIMQGELEQALTECEPGSKTEQAFLNLAEETHRLKKITQDLLMLARVDSGTLNLSSQPVVLSDVLELFSEDASILCEHAGLTFACESKDPNLTIAANQDALLTVLHNLLSNAIKYNTKGGSVSCSFAREGEQVILRLANTGKGIPKEDQNRIFDRFYRADRARSRSVDGFGLGLNIAQEMTRATGGELTLERSDDSMTVFAIAFTVTGEANA